MPTLLTKEDILGLKDIATKEITVPDTIPAWGGMTLVIKQLTRGQQDAYLERQYGSTKMKQDGKAKNQEIGGMKIYGHDAWLVVRAVCVDASGILMFTDADIPKLNEKSGEAIGWIAAEIVKFSGMDGDAKVARGEITPEAQLEADIKN
jgi:hypothetical protein